MRAEVEIKDAFNMFRHLLEKEKLVREINDGKNKIPHKFLGRKI